MQDQLGPVEFFSGAMAAASTRKAKVIKCLEAVTFSTLVMQFPAGPADASAVAPTAVTFPPLFDLRDVKSFRLATGSVEVVYVA
jgi:hypothetical protein